MSLIILVSLLMVVTSAGDIVTTKLWNYNVTLDFGDQIVTVDLRPQVSDLNMVQRSTIFRGNGPDDWGGIYLMENMDQSVPVLEGNLWGLMHPLCKGVISKQGYIGVMDGMVATGSSRVEHGFGQECYGGATILSDVDNSEVFTFMILGHFTNETLNQDFVKNVRIEYVG
jgi:hypothetical protein